MAKLLHSTLHLLPHTPSESAVKATSSGNTRSGRPIDNFGSSGAALRKSAGAFEDSCFRACNVRLNQSVENSWNVRCSFPPRSLSCFNAKRNGRPMLLSSGGNVCAASRGQGSTGEPLPEEEDPEAGPGQAPPPDGAQHQPTEPSQMSGGVGGLDWRAFRARLVQSEHLGAETTSKEGCSPAAEKRWAHPILAPEAGCLLIATEKLDGQQSFERTVILLLSSGSANNPREGPYGFILNKPISRRIKDIKPKDRILVKQFGNCPAHFGGPLDTEVFLLLHGTSGLQGYQEVIPGVYYGAADGLESAAQFAKEENQSFPQGFRFFFGYSGWGYDQLKQEINAGLWFVSACSSELITSASTAGLWEEVLQLMGGKYAELSKRPKRKHF